MKAYRIFSAAGPDRGGIVHQVSRFVFEHRCNIEDSRMAVLGGQFAMMVLVSGDGGDVTRLEADLTAFSGQSGLRAILLPAASPLERPRAPGLPVRIEVVAMDAPGILVKIAQVLDAHGVTVETLDTHLSPAPASGATISAIKIKVQVPPDRPLRELREALTLLSAQMNLDIGFQPVQE
jgi:glycine cleavage system transcriptional repressor